MIKKLRRKFILISLVAVGIVIYLILGITNYMNFQRVYDNANTIMEVLKEYKGKFPQNMEPEIPEGDEFYPITEDTPYETRFFSVILDEDGNTIYADTKKISSIDEDEAAYYAETLYNENRLDGYYDSLRFSCLKNDEGTMYIFIDCSRSIDMAENFLIYSLVFSLVGISAFFVLLIFLSKIMIRPVEESYIKQKSFITNASHDIKTPLTIISADTEIIEMENGESEWTNDVKAQIVRLTDLTNKLVFLSKIDESEYVMSKVDVDISKVLNNVLKSYNSLSQNKQINVTTSIEDDVIINGNEEMLKQLFSLLIDNAFKYSSENGNINIELKKVGKQTKIIFENDVDDIEIGDHKRLFERFYRMDSSRNSSTGGHGIGLSVVKEIVTLHKGKITCKSETNKTIKFTILL